MTYKEETYVLDTLTELRDFIRSPDVKQALKEIHENNVMLKQICKVINTYIARHHNENNEDFDRNVLANLISSGLDFSRIFNR